MWLIASFMSHPILLDDGTEFALLREISICNLNWYEIDMFNNTQDRACVLSTASYENN